MITSRDCLQLSSWRRMILVAKIYIYSKDFDHADGLGCGLLGLGELRKRFLEQDVGIEVLKQSC